MGACPGDSEQSTILGSSTMNSAAAAKVHPDPAEQPGNGTVMPRGGGVREYLENPPSFLAFCFAVFIVLPTIVIIIATIFGGILASMEGWSFKPGFYYVVGNLCALATPLTDITPTSDAGKVVDILVAVWSLSIAAIFIGMVGGMNVVGKATTFLDYFGLLDVSSVSIDKLVDSLKAVEELNFQQFKTMLRSAGYLDDYEEPLRRLYDKVDTSGNGKLDKLEIEALYNTFLRVGDPSGLGISDKELAVRAIANAESWQIMVEQKALAKEAKEQQGRLSALERMVGEIHAAVMSNAEQNLSHRESSPVKSDTPHDIPRMPSS